MKKMIHFNEEPTGNLELDLEIRIATEADAEGLTWLNQELLTFYGLPAPNQRSFVSHAISKGVFKENSGLKILLALENGNSIGFLAFSEIFALASCQKSIFIQDLFVARKVRKSGAGRALMNALFNFAKDNEITQIDWTTDAWNSKAIALYEHIVPSLKTEKILYRLNEERLNQIIKK
jgi:GNAT superfamily N-acetyltransferase